MATVTATETIALLVDGEKVIVHRGESWDSSHPVVKKYPGVFGIAAPRRRTGAVVETKTRRPSERAETKPRAPRNPKSKPEAPAGPDA